ncbi:MAG: response regulator [Blautia marasmi]
MQKLKLMIVDDEYLIRQYIRNCIDWERLGYTIVGELGTAQGALQLAEELKPDVVLTDICMPGLDGLSFTGLLKELSQCKSDRRYRT